MGFLDHWLPRKPTVREVWYAAHDAERDRAKSLAELIELDLTTNLSVKCVKGRQLHLWRRIGSWSSPYWLCAYCGVPCGRAWQHEGVFDMNAATICDEIQPPADGDAAPAPRRDLLREAWAEHKAKAGE